MVEMHAELEFLRRVLLQNADLNVIPAAGNAKTGLSALLIALLTVPVIALIVVIVIIYKHSAGKRRNATLKDSYIKEAEGHEKAGRFVSAAVIYENKLKDARRAAELYERGGDYRQAASLYDLLGLSSKAKEMYQKEGDIDSAAEVSVLEGEYEEAAGLYYGSSKKIDAAVMMEKAGRKMAAARIYREAGEYRKAAELMEEEGILKGAAEMFGISLRDKNVADCKDDFYTYALKLEKAGDKEAALKIFRAINDVDDHYKDVRGRLEKIEPATVVEDNTSTTTLRSFLRGGRIEPRHALKLWVHILRALQRAYKDGETIGPLSPENIAIDANNNIHFLNKPSAAIYAAPDMAKGIARDACTDIYSAGIILYEMLTGDLEGFGSARLINKVEDVPEWLDEIVLRCVRKVREDRYSSIELILNDIKALSQERKRQGGKEGQP